MRKYGPRCNAAQITLAIVCFTCVAWLPSIASGDTTMEPHVEAMVKKALTYLERSMKEATYFDEIGFASGANGEHALAGYAHMKAAHDPNNPVVQRGVAAALRVTRGLSPNDPGTHYSKTIYNLGVCAMLLAEVDRDKFKTDLQKIISHLKSVQYRNGPYGYFGDVKGDVSQVQYAMLGLWTIDRAGLPVHYDRVPSTIDWLLRVQDPNGGWPYMGEDPGQKGRIKQARVSASMAVAGGSGILIAGDLLRIWGQKAESAALQPGFPKAIKEADDVSTDHLARPKIPVDPIVAAIQQCDGYLAKNSPDPGKLLSKWPYYQLYTLERYESFKEIALGSNSELNPKWFRDGVAFLKSKQTSQGGFPKSSITSMVSTSLAILFLIRSTKAAIEQSQEGTLAGGFGLPGDTTNITVNGTQIKGETVAGAVDDLLDMLEGDEGDALEGKSLPEDMELPTEPKARRATVDRLERLVRGSNSWQARRVAARLLAQSDEMKVVPSLIFALDDPDTAVRTFARDGLRFISRKFEGFGMEISRGDKQDYGELRKAQRLWRKWYLTMDPGYIFVTD